MLYPVNNTKRISISLNGLWNFAFADDLYDPKSKIKEPILMGVPSSYNDLFTTIKERDHVGNVVYEKELLLPEILNGEWRIRLGSAAHKAKCYVDGEQVCSHNGGFLPVDFAIPTKEKIRLTIVLDNRLDYQTLPIASLKKENGKEIVDTHFLTSLITQGYIEMYFYITYQKIQSMILLSKQKLTKKQKYLIVLILYQKISRL